MADETSSVDDSNVEVDAPKKRGRPPGGANIPMIPIPEIWTGEGETKELKELSAQDFPKSRPGRIAFYKYRIEAYKVKIEEELDASSDDPIKKKKRRVKRLKALIAKLTQEIDDEDDDEAEAVVAGISDDDEDDNV